MIKVITYGTFDMLHYGHRRLLERAKALGDYLIVGVTAEDFDRSRGKINVRQTLMDRIAGVKATGLADEIIVEEYEGQKIDDILRYDIDIFTVGTDWVGKFDYLNEYCKVIYLERTEGISSTEIRSEESFTRLGIVGDIPHLRKFVKESTFVNGAELSGASLTDTENDFEIIENIELDVVDFKTLLGRSDAVYISSHPSKHYEQVKQALENGKHVLCEAPLALSYNECEELFKIAEKNGLILMEALKTAFSTAYSRLILLAKSGRIGNIVSVDATCTSLSYSPATTAEERAKLWNTMCAWGPTALLPVFGLLGKDYRSLELISKTEQDDKKFDLFTQINLRYDSAVASLKIGKGVKSESEMIISGVKGYIYVPSPWWKTDYFELRYENPQDNRRYFYQLDGEGIRYEIACFLKSIGSGKVAAYLSKEASLFSADVVGRFYSGDYTEI
ncbi:MAG: Gfo/Idh/MocA family oxidoreductase [Lachnospiraceae bacterium]|nr:Gfo/Idh/MocA family oxidoreductase [Lachnospiraceae bacterium]